MATASGGPAHAATRSPAVIRSSPRCSASPISSNTVQAWTTGGKNTSHRRWHGEILDISLELRRRSERTKGALLLRPLSMPTASGADACQSRKEDPVKKAQRLSVTLFAAALALAGNVLMAQPSSAALGDWWYDGRDPTATGCVNDARTIDSRAVGGGATIYLRYSPSCRTVWARITGAATRTPDRAGGSALIYREQDGAGIRCHTGSGHACSTNMLYDAGFTSHATGTNDVGWIIYRATTISY